MYFMTHCEEVEETFFSVICLCLRDSAFTEVKTDATL